VVAKISIASFQFVNK